MSEQPAPQPDTLQPTELTRPERATAASFLSRSVSRLAHDYGDAQSTAGRMTASVTGLTRDEQLYKFEFKADNGVLFVQAVKKADGTELQKLSIDELFASIGENGEITQDQATYLKVLYSGLVADFQHVTHTTAAETTPYVTDATQPQFNDYTSTFDAMDLVMGDDPRFAKIQQNKAYIDDVRRAQWQKQGEDQTHSPEAVAANVRFLTGSMRRLIEEEGDNAGLLDRMNAVPESSGVKFTYRLSDTGELMCDISAKKEDGSVQHVPLSVNATLDAISQNQGLTGPQIRVVQETYNRLVGEFYRVTNTGGDGALPRVTDASRPYFNELSNAFDALHIAMESATSTNLPVFARAGKDTINQTRLDLLGNVGIATPPHSADDTDGAPPQPPPEDAPQVSARAAEDGAMRLAGDRSTTSESAPFELSGTTNIPFLDDIARTIGMEGVYKRQLTADQSTEILKTLVSSLLGGQTAVTANIGDPQVQIEDGPAWNVRVPVHITSPRSLKIKVGCRLGNKSGSNDQLEGGTLVLEGDGFGQGSLLKVAEAAVKATKNIDIRSAAEEQLKDPNSAIQKALNHAFANLGVAVSHVSLHFLDNGSLALSFKGNPITSSNASLTL